MPKLRESRASTSRRPGTAALVLVVAVAFVIGTYALSPVEGLWIGLLPFAVLWPTNVFLGGGLNEPWLRALDRVLEWWQSHRKQQAASPEARGNAAICSATERLHGVLRDHTSSNRQHDQAIAAMEDALTHAASDAIAGPGRGMLDLAYRRRYGHLGLGVDLENAVNNARERVRCVDQHPAPVNGRKRASSRIRYAEWLLTRADLNPNAADLDVAASVSAIARRVGDDRQRAIAQSLYEEAVSKRMLLMDGP
jgi:hypothetical protein